MKRFVREIVTVFMLGSVGCTDLIDMTPESDVTFYSYFNTEQDAEALLSTMEECLRSSAANQGHHGYYGWIADHVNETYAPYRELEQTMAMNWQSYYTTLNKADVIIDNARRFPNSVDIKPYVLQAYFAKGVTYFELARKWGEAPIRGEDHSDYSPLPKSSVHDVLEEATKYALLALDLPNFEELKDGNGSSRTVKQFAGKGAVCALLGHLYAWRATIENKPEYWAEAEKYCSMIIDGKAGNYVLANTPEDLCLNEMHRNGQETIWELYYEPNEVYGTGNIWGDADYIGFPVRTESNFLPNTNYYWAYSVEIYRSTVNKLFHKEDRRRNAYFWGTDADSLFVVYNKVSGKTNAIAVEYDENGDRKVFTKYDNGNNCPVELEYFLSEGDSIIEGGGYATKDHERAYVIKHRYPYYVKRYDWESEPSFDCYDVNKVIWRLADIILLRAECRVHQNDRDGAIADLNRIRERAYGNRKFDYPCEDDIEKNLTADLQLAIFREREKELMFEDCRFYDAVRNGWGQYGYDYVRNELSPGIARLTDQDIEDGALYHEVGRLAFTNNELMKQNAYWKKKRQ